jgi:hypothetical protein
MLTDSVKTPSFPRVHRWDQGINEGPTLVAYVAIRLAGNAALLRRLIRPSPAQTCPTTSPMPPKHRPGLGLVIELKMASVPLITGLRTLITGLGAVLRRRLSLDNDLLRSPSFS